MGELKSFAAGRLVLEGWFWKAGSGRLVLEGWLDFG
jgi:hypothetical protein